MSIQSLPPEIHSHLLSFAYSPLPLHQSHPSPPSNPAHTLSLVSRYWHALAHPFRFTSASVHGPERIAKLLDALERAPPHQRRVTRLFVSDCDTPSHTVNGLVDADDCEQDGNYDYDPDTSDHHLRVLERLIAITAPHLQVLVLHIHNPYTSTPFLARVWSTQFPRLERLIISGIYPLPVSLHIPSSDQEHLSTKIIEPSMPRLQSLHLHGMRNPAGLFELGGLNGLCPNLTHLRLSGIAAARSFAKEIGRVIKTRRTENDAKQLGERRSSGGNPTTRIANGIHIPMSNDEAQGLSSNLNDSAFHFAPAPTFPPRLPERLSHLTIGVPTHCALPPRCGARYERLHAEMITLLETLPNASSERFPNREFGTLTVEVIREVKEDTIQNGLRMVSRAWHMSA